MKKTINSKYLFIWVIVAFAIPVILNFLLQIRTGLVILGGSSSQTMWLSFWGSYLSAIASGLLACASLVINQKSIEQNDKILHNSAWEKLSNRYNRLENFICSQEMLYNDIYVEEILEYLENNSNMKSSYIAKKERMVTVSGLKINRFLEQDKANEFHNKTGECLKKYGGMLYEANDLYLKFILNIKNYNNNKNNNTFNYKEFKDTNENTINSIKISYNGILKYGRELLIAEKNRILEYALKHHIEHGIL